MIFVGLPSEMDRFNIIKLYLKDLNHWVTDAEVRWLSQCTNDYSPDDLNNLLTQATEYCLHESHMAEYAVATKNYYTPTYDFDNRAEPMAIAKKKYVDKEFRPNPLKLDHITDAMRKVKATVDPEELSQLLEFRRKYAPESTFNVKRYLHKRTKYAKPTNL